MKPFTHALALGVPWVSTEGSCKRLFLLLFPNSKTMRYVGGGLLKNPVTRANHSREGGRRIEPGGRKASFLTPFCKSVQCDAMTWLRWANHSKHKRTVVIEHGKAVLCSNIHQKAGV